MGPFLRMSGQINTAEFFAQGTAAVNAGLSVAVFPEGKRAEQTGLRRFRGGAFELAERTGTPILPVVLDGTRFILARRGFAPWRTFVTVHLQVLPPIAPGPDAKAQATATMTPVLAAMQDAA
jgi:1-acyl-sn-glycerol-3-phosphate acyltransferase